MTDAGATLPTEPKGIGGWLILPMLTTLVSPLLILRTIVETFPALETELSSGLRAFVIGEIVFNLALIVGWFFVAVQLFRHRRSFPGLFIAMLAVGFAGLLADAIIGVWAYAVEIGPEDYRDLARNVIALLIWTPYMAKSKRVRNTFIEG
jgi:hypothetical protein